MEWLWLVILTCFVIGVTHVLAGRLNNSKNATESIERTKESAENGIDGENSDLKELGKIILFYGTTGGFCRQLAVDIKKLLLKKGSFEEDDLSLINIAHFEHDDYEQIPAETKSIFIVPTFTDGAPPPSCQAFFDWLADTATDFRVDKANYLRNIQFSVVGVGSKDYGKLFCVPAKNLRKKLLDFGSKELTYSLFIDDQRDVEVLLESFVESFLSDDPKNLGMKQVDAIETVSEEIDEVEEEDLINESYLMASDDEDEFEEKKESSLVDLEDLVDESSANNLLGKTTKDKREMVTKAQRKALTKEGYKIIGSHSAVKLCRWTKHQLRGRGGCYKHTFYNITSYQCMEMTPSLACANKCVFCWRHHKNPVGTSWRWKEDSPEEIVADGVKYHVQMVKAMNGVPGAKPERLQEAKTVRHCALSLVGEPIMYPRINQLVKELHNRSISSFLVTNGQFPDPIKSLGPVTQLYVSIDAGDKDSLKEIDRPLFKDFWQRYIDSLTILKDKQQRTVYRFTMVKQWNFEDETEMQEIANYVKLISLGEPDLIEIKAVTYCGTSAASSLTMKNVPWHHEVKKFASKLCDIANEKFTVSNSTVRYGRACEHVHSCCVLIAREDKFLIEGKWHTWINYDKYHQLIQRYYETDGKENFTSIEYSAETPAWALWDASEKGFDPNEKRFRKVRNHPQKE